MILIAIFCMLIAGCVDNPKSAGTTTSPATPAVQVPLTPVRIPVNATNCTVPALIFDESQEITTSFGEINCSTPSVQGNVPLGGIVYSTQGFTKIFDNSGKQILIIDDRKATSRTPAGITSSTSVIGPSCHENSEFIRENDSFVRVYLPDSAMCSVIFVRTAGWTPVFTPNIPKT
jgi:hypothetical protein